MTSPDWLLLCCEKKKARGEGKVRRINKSDWSTEYCFALLRTRDYWTGYWTGWNERTKERHPFLLSRYPFSRLFSLSLSSSSPSSPFSSSSPFFAFLDRFHSYFIPSTKPLPLTQGIKTSSIKSKSRRGGCTSKRIPVKTPPESQPPGPSLSLPHLSIFLPIQIRTTSSSSPIQDTSKIHDINPSP